MATTESVESRCRSGGCVRAAAGPGVRDRPRVGQFPGATGITTGAVGPTGASGPAGASAPTGLPGTAGSVVGSGPGGSAPDSLPVVIGGTIGAAGVTGT